MPSRFTTLFQERLKSELQKRTMGLEVYDEYWLKVSGKRILPVDIMLKSAEKIILIEIEMHRQDPSNNVAKILYWLKMNKPSKEIMVIQLFSPFYEEHRIKKAVSEELGAILEKEYAVSYLSVPFTPKFDNKKFDELYREPEKHLKETKILAEETAKALTNLIFIK